MVCHEMAFLPPPSSDHQFFFQNHHQQLSEHHHDAAQNHHQSNSNSDPTSLSILTSSCPPQDFLGHHPHLSTLTMMNHHHHSLSPSTAGYGGGGGGSLISNDQFPAASNNNHHHVGSNTNSMNGEEDALSEDEASHFMALGEKKKRLNMEQVKTLEKNFELGNKLEPERKMQLAKALGLQPRQVAIWFQNRRARWKTKQLEKDYNLLKRQFDNLKGDNELLQTQNKKLHAELVALKNGKEPATTAEFEPAAGGGGGDGPINLNTDTKSYCWSNNGSEISSDINLGISTTPTPPHGDHHHHHHHHQQQPHSPPPACNIDNNHKLQFQSSFLPMSLTDLLTKPSSHHPHHDHTLQDDGFCTLFGTGGGSGGGTSTTGGGGVASEQPPPFWAWPTDQHHMQ